MLKSNTFAIAVSTFILASIALLSQHSHTTIPPEKHTTKPTIETKPSSTAKRRTPRVLAMVDRPLPPQAPDTLAAKSDIIVLGKITKILAVRPTPIDCPDTEGWMGNHTVYAFEVEKYLKGTGANTVKIHNDGGTVNDVEYYQSDNPGLVVGERYFLFLKSYADDKRNKKLGFIPCGVGQKTYRLGDLDELFPVHVQRSKLHIDNGVLVQATDENHLLPTWHFEDRGCDQLIGVTEQEAHAVIRKAINDSVGLGKSVVYSDAPL